MAEHLAFGVVDVPEHEDGEGDDADHDDGQTSGAPGLEDARGPHASPLDLPAHHLEHDGEPDGHEDADRPQPAVDEPTPRCGCREWVASNA